MLEILAAADSPLTRRGSTAVGDMLVSLVADGVVIETERAYLLAR